MELLIYFFEIIIVIVAFLCKGFINLHKMIFGLGVAQVIADIRDRESILRILIEIAVLILVLFFLLCIDLLIIGAICSFIHWVIVTIRTKERKISNVNATIINKRIDNSFHVFIPNILEIFDFAKYLTEVEYDGIITEIDNKEIFEKYIKSDTITLKLIEKYDRKGKIIDRKLELA